MLAGVNGCKNDENVADFPLELLYPLSFQNLDVEQGHPGQTPNMCCNRDDDPSDPHCTSRHPTNAQ
eukprot:3338689-Lingulodinium_polyedra.AAC.1